MTKDRNVKDESKKVYSLTEALELLQEMQRRRGVEDDEPQPQNTEADE